MYFDWVRAVRLRSEKPVYGSAVYWALRSEKLFVCCFKASNAKTNEDEAFVAFPHQIHSKN
jgi:hypothetical protein